VVISTMGEEMRNEDQVTFTLSKEKWAAFVQALDAPPQVNERLRELFSSPTALDLATRAIAIHNDPAVSEEAKARAGRLAALTDLEGDGLRRYFPK
jgi:ATP phosphoribosyltransferase regulatory subunit HisZ